MPFRKSRGWGNTPPPAGTQVDIGDPLAKGLAIWLPMTEGGGAIIQDATGPLHNGVLVNGPTWVPGPRAGRALSFVTASAQYVNSPNFVWPANSPVSVSLWAKMGTPTGLNYGFGMPNTGNARFQAHFPFTDNLLYFDYGDYAAGGRVSVSAVPYLGKWTYFVLTSDGVSGGVSAIWANGIKIASSTAKAYTGGTGLQVANAVGGGAWTGSMRNFRLHNRVIQPGEIRELYQDEWRPFAAPTRRIISQVAAAGGTGTAFAADLAANASAAGALTTAIPLAASLQAAAAASGALTTAIPLAAGLSALASISASLTAPGSGLAANLVASASLSGALTTAIPLAASMGAAASVSAGLLTAIRFGASLQTASIATGSLSTSIRLAAALSAAAGASGSLTTAIPLGSALSAAAAASGALTTGIRFAAALQASSALTGSLVVVVTAARPGRVRFLAADSRVLPAPADLRVLIVPPDS
jgi:hypothetical protein